MNCPLCTQVSSILLRTYPVTELNHLWIKSFGFSPFSKKRKKMIITKRQCAECNLIYFDPPYYGDGEFYRKLSKFPWYYETIKWEFDLAAQLISEIKPASFLEIGCGNGSFLNKITALVKRVEGIDINENAINQCIKKGLAASTTPIKDLEKSYEIIALFEVLEHMDHLSETIHDIVKAISPEGHLILAVPNPEGYLKNVEINLLDMPPHHNSSWAKKTFEYVAYEYNLEIIGYYQEPLRYVHYLCYLGNIIGEHRAIMHSGVKKKLFSFIQSAFLNIFAPFAYLQHRENIVGQTHMVLLRKR